VSEAVALLERDGYGAQVMLLPDGRLRCAGCSDTHAADAVFVERVLRFEGASNPDDEAIVMGVRCPGCHQKGTLVSAYGPGADPELADALVLLERRFDGGDPESTQSAP
jgi:hypothetical protein